MSRYKDYMIYGAAVPARSIGGTHGIVFDRDLNQTTEIKRIESTARTFKTKETGRRIRA